ncbi:MAG: Flp pilus assembly protein CpaB [Pseudonocardiales bacterium]|nr:MAG: Flp pilus assembly protein CpaB [Pseudonocardiales bacterium]
MNRRIVLVVIATVLALVGTLAVFNYTHNADKRAIAKTRSVSVLVAAKSVPAGTSWGDVLKGKYLEEQRVPVDSAPSAAIANLAASVPRDQVAGASIPAGQIVLRPTFGEKTVTTGALAIPAGTLAVSVTMTANADVAGYVQNGSEVAIFSTFKLAPAAKGSAVEANSAGIDRYITKLLLARASVIATSQAAPSVVNGSKANANGSSSGDVLVTLALSQAEAQRVILAQQVGQLYLALLSDKSVTVPDGGVTNVGVFSPTPIFVK